MGLSTRICAQPTEVLELHCNASACPASAALVLPIQAPQMFLIAVPLPDVQQEVHAGERSRLLVLQAFVGRLAQGRVTMTMLVQSLYCLTQYLPL